MWASYKKIKEAVHWHHDQIDKAFMPESLCWQRQEKTLHTAVLRTAGEVYDSFKHVEVVILQLYFQDDGYLKWGDSPSEYTR